MSDIETKSESDFASDVKLDDIELNVQIVLLDIYKKMDKILDILNKLEMEATSVKAKVTPKELPSSSTTKATTSTPTCLGKTTKNLPCKRKPSSDPNIHPYCSTHVSQRKNVSKEYVDDCE
ncbi:hypothetical protein DFJ73DRAFT_763217 [Zopfochytrium polystomum]|nr:hypothetical protein DFJ73DRAFT_763217 [Zopfochytrium polystomum]